MNRGLPNIETTVNGYEVYTGTARGLALQDIPAEMIAGVDVFKTSGPDKIEGGVAGLIDVRLRRPFDFAGPAAGHLPAEVRRKGEGAHAHLAGLECAGPGAIGLIGVTAH